MDKKTEKRVTLSDFKKDASGQVILKNGKPVFQRIRTRTEYIKKN